MTVRVYIAGPITGHADHNRPAFDRAERALRAAGLHPVNPHRLHGDAPGGWKSHAEYMRTDLAALLDCAAITLLPGWQDSPGASLEAQVAAAVGLRGIALPLDPRFPPYGGAS